MTPGRKSWFVLAGLGALAIILIFPPFGVAGEEIVLKTRQGDYRISVEIADTPEARSRGLMFREALADDRGMLFLYPSPREVSMWMKNTLISLDMLFVSGDGRIVRVARNAQPHSLTTIPSGEPVIAVLEIGGGRSAALGVKAGDRLESSVPLDSALK